LQYWRGATKDANGLNYVQQFSSGNAWPQQGLWSVCLPSQAHETQRITQRLAAFCMVVAAATNIQASKLQREVFQIHC
jgi:hypothetical protein